MNKHKPINTRNKYLSMAIMAGVIAWVGLISGCVNTVGAKAVTLLQEKKNMPHQSPADTPAQFAYLYVPAGVDVASIEMVAIDEKGHAVTGTAQPINTPKGELPQVFWWDLTRQQWQWIKAEANDAAYSTPVGINSAGNLVLGSQWVWQSGTRKITKLEPNFWAYAVRDDHMLLGVELGHRIVMQHIDGTKKEAWKTEQILSLLGKEFKGGLGLEPQLWFAPNGYLVSSTLSGCLEDPHCGEAYFIRWSPEAQKVAIPVQLPEREADNLIQASLGSQVVSANGAWLLKSVGQKIYLWNEAGEIQFLGGFPNGGAVLSISNDGRMAVGTSIDETTLQERSWLWTQTEGLGWLDEWLVNHGVAQANVSKNMQVKTLSADRRVLLGVTPAEGEATSPQWWKVQLPEKLRVLM